MILRKIELATSPTPRLRREQKEEKETRKKEENFLPFLSSPPPPPPDPRTRHAASPKTHMDLNFIMEIVQVSKIA